MPHRTFDSLRCALVNLLTIGFAVSGHAVDADWRAIPLVENGKVSSAWQQVGWGRFVVEGDTIRTDPSEKGLGVLVYTKETLGNCQLRIVYRPQNSRCNAGVHIRMDEGILNWVGKDSPAVQRDANGKLPAEMQAKMKAASEHDEGAWYAVNRGYEVQIMDGGGDGLHRTGAVYSLAPSAKAIEKPADDWRTMVITLQGNVVLVEQDGQPLTRFDSVAKDLPERKQWFEPKREPQRPQAGYIGLQTHDPGDIVFFREFSVRKLP